jgi:hypothetical protein
MYPPVRTEKLEDALKGLWESLSRAGDHFNGNGYVEQSDDKRTVVRLYLTDSLGNASGAFANYARLYLRECGWTVTGITTMVDYVRLKIRRRR